MGRNDSIISLLSGRKYSTMSHEDEDVNSRKSLKKCSCIRLLFKSNLQENSINSKSKNHF
uniref:Uncharacterized protein n=1 Tax=Heterorhabditis bacteriophora TaxID=37862 RepID=A0A1I7WI90_HETBA